MKTFKRLLLAAAILALQSAAYAQTTIYIVGSNGDRTATQTAIGNLLTNWTYQGNKGYATSTGTPAGIAVPQGDNYGVWLGTFGTSGTVRIKVSFLGAWAGLQYVADSSQQAPFVAQNTPANTGNLADPSTLTAPNANLEKHSANFGFSTNFQATSPYSGNYAGHTYANLNDTIVGITPLIFYASPGFPGSPSSTRPTFRPNITTQLLYSLYSGGEIRLSQITGDYSGSDKTSYIYPLGRNTDAGQRYGVLTEFGLGVNGVVRHVAPQTSYKTVATLPATPTSQHSYTINGQSVKAGGTVSYQTLWPTETVSGTSSGSDGNSGFTTGSNLAPYLTVTLGAGAYKNTYEDPIGGQTDAHPDATSGYYIGYLPPGDGLTRVTDTTTLPTSEQGVDLSFNGVRYSAANVQNGTYTAWIYNHLVDRGDLTGTTATFATALANNISTVTATALNAGIFNDSNVKVKRAGEGSAVIPQ